MSLAAAIDAEAARLTSDLVRIRRTLHANPELAFEEHETAALVASHLDALGLSVQRGIGRTGVVAVLEGARPGPTVGLRADMDALPIQEATGLPYASTRAGRMHACGHDLHTAIGLGVASVLCGLRDRIAGRVKFIFQPAEEVLRGAAAMIADGVLDAPRVDTIVSFHNWPVLPAGRVGYTRGLVMASSDGFEITLKGVSGHAAHPHTTVDVIAGAAYLVAQLQTIVSREVAPIRPAVVSIGQLTAGTAPNILPETATLAGTVRTLDGDTRTAIERAIARHLDGLRAGMRVDSILDYRRGVPVLRNDDAVLDRALASVRAAIGADNVVELVGASMGTEDFSCFTERVPGVYLRIGSQADATTAMLHNAGFAPDERAIAVGVRAMSRVVLDLVA